MKRIFTILILVCFVAVMAVPAFAADVNTVSGVWIFNETISRYSDTSNLMASPLNFSSNGETFNTIQLLLLLLAILTPHQYYNILIWKTLYCNV